MARKEIVICDKCGDNTSSCEVIGIQFGWVTDIAGGYGEPDSESFDLCSRCTAMVLRRLLKLVTDEQRRELLKELLTGTNRENGWSNSKQEVVKRWEM